MSVSVSPGAMPPALIGRSVLYKEKDTHHSEEHDFSEEASVDDLMHWFRISFWKSHDYKHEDEYRLLLAHPLNVGGLPKGQHNLIIPSSEMIAASIVDCTRD